MGDQPSQWRAGTWLLLLSVVIGAVFAPTLFQQRSLVPADLGHQLLLPFGHMVTNVTVQNHYAMDALALDYSWGWFWKLSVQRGELPLWNPWINGGHPHLAESAPAVFNPFHLLHLGLATERAFSIGVVLAVWWAGVCMWFFLRELGRSRFAAGLGALAWALNSAFLMWYWRAPAPFAWVPLVLLGFERAIRRDSLRASLAGGLALAVALVSGSIQTAGHIGFLCVFYMGGAIGRGRLAIWTAIIILTLGVLGSAIQWVPTLELMAQNVTWSAERGGQPGWRHTVVGLPLLLTFLFPALAGSPESYDLLKLAGATMGDFTGYIGLVPAALALLGAVTAQDRPARTVRWLVVGVWVVIFFTPLVRFVYHRFFVVAVFAGAVLAAYGADALPTAGPTTRRVLATLVVLAGMVALGLVTAQILWTVWPDTLRATAEQFILPRARTHVFGHQEQWFQQRIALFFEHYRLTNPVFAVPLLGLLAVTLAWRWQVRRGVLHAVIVAATITDLVVLARLILPQVDLARYPLLPPHPLLAPVQADPELFRVDRLGPTHEVLWRPNQLQMYGLADRWGLMSLAPPNLNSLPIRTGETFNRVLDLHNVKYIFTDTGTALPAPRFTPLGVADGVRLYRNETCLPRVRWVTEVRVIPSRPELAAYLTGPDYQPEREVLLEQPVEIPIGPEGTATFAVTTSTPRRVMVRVNASQPGVLVLADTFYKGWQAQVDGRAAPIHRADYCLRAVAVPAGEHVVEFRYAPRSVRLGAALSLVGLLGAGAGWLLVVRRSTRPIRPAKRRDGRHRRLADEGIVVSHQALQEIQRARVGQPGHGFNRRAAHFERLIRQDGHRQ